VTDGEVVLNEQTESQEVAATQDENDITTWKKRLAGKDQALTTTKKQLDELKAEHEKVVQWKLQMEEASLSEFERAQRKIAALEQELNAAREAEKRERLSKEFPNYTTWAESSKDLTDEDRARAFEEMIRKGLGKSEETFVDPNKPAKATPAKAGKRSSDEIVRDIAALGNPWSD